MRLFFSLLIRIIVLSLSFIIATLVVGIFLAFILFLGGDPTWLAEDSLAAGGAIGYALVAWIFIAGLSFAPAALIMLALEFTRASSLVANLLAGGACALVAMIMFEPSTGFESDGDWNAQRFWLVAIAAGFIAGFTHWLIAGRRAGRWMETTNSPTRVE